MFSNVYHYLVESPWIFVVFWGVSLLIIQRMYSDVKTREPEPSDPDGWGGSLDEISNEKRAKFRKFAYYFTSAIFLSLTLIFAFQ